MTENNIGRLNSLTLKIRLEAGDIINYAVNSVEAALRNTEDYTVTRMIIERSGAIFALAPSYEGLHQLLTTGEKIEDPILRNDLWHGYADVQTQAAFEHISKFAGKLQGSNEEINLYHEQVNLFANFLENTFQTRLQMKEEKTSSNFG